jgi:hypothetical protein
MIRPFTPGKPILRPSRPSSSLHSRKEEWQQNGKGSLTQVPRTKVAGLSSFVASMLQGYDREGTYLSTIVLNQALAFNEVATGRRRVKLKAASRHINPHGACCRTAD